MPATRSPAVPLDQFAPDFTAARARFRDSAHAAGPTRMGAIAHPLPGPDQQDLSCDWAWFGPEKAARVVVVISGLHGVEGWAGSAVQIAWCDEGAVLPPDTAMLLIHAINPWGMAWDRRQQEDNIDLNRHFVDFAALPDDSAYADHVAAVMCPDTDPAARAAADAHLAAFQASAGRRAAGMVLQGGQYHWPEAPSYGGAAPAWSRKVLDELLGSLCAAAKVVVVCDIHTGYGPYGYGIPLWHMLAGPQFEAARHLFGPTLEAPLAGEGAEDEFIQHGHLYGYIQGLVPGAFVVPMCFEFGAEVLRPGQRALLERADALAWASGDRLSAEARANRRRWRALHCPDRDDWREMVWARGRQLLRELTSRIGQI